MTDRRDFKAFFSAFTNANPARLHFAAHSHHPWPDVTLKAQRQYWQDTTRLLDDKWDHIFGEIVPGVQKHIARHLKLHNPNTIAFAPNTHEFVLRLLSCLPTPSRILTTDSEFHSFSRQVRRLQEDGKVELTTVPTEPFETFPDRFAAAMRPDHHMVFFSHVFFNSGYAVPNLARLVAAVPNPETLVVIDGYHGFMALPTDLSAIQHRAFYFSGGYKYAMAGEGACFMHCPPAVALRPVNTGWFAAFGALAGPNEGKVAYAPDGSRFMGATFDPTGLYRMLAIMDMLASNGITVTEIHDHVIALQTQFLAELRTPPGERITPVNTIQRGHFLTYETPHAEMIYHCLQDRGIITDYRANRLRFGFGIYQDEGDVAALVNEFKISDLTIFSPIAN
jgi:kynureninase